MQHYKNLNLKKEKYKATESPISSFFVDSESRSAATFSLARRSILAILLIYLFVIGFFLPGAGVSHAADYVVEIEKNQVIKVGEKESDVLREGDVVSVSVLVSSDDAVNAASGTVAFSNNSLELVSIDKRNSVFDFWFKEPEISIERGEVYFEGVIFNPGFTGERGVVMGLNFKVKKAGQSSVSVSEGAVLANDGKATSLALNYVPAQLTADVALAKTETQKQEVNVNIFYTIFSALLVVIITLFAVLQRYKKKKKASRGVSLF